jgi:hypothetical protein
LQFPACCCSACPVHAFFAAAAAACCWEHQAQARVEINREVALAALCAHLAFAFAVGVERSCRNDEVSCCAVICALAALLLHLHAAVPEPSRWGLFTVHMLLVQLALVVRLLAHVGVAVHIELFLCGWIAIEVGAKSCRYMCCVYPQWCVCRSRRTL